MHSFAIGVDLGGTNMRIAAVEDSGRLLQIISSATQVQYGRDFVISEICAGIRTLARQFGSTHELLGIGVGIPGIIDLASGTLHSAANLPGWHNYPVKTELEKHLGVPVVLENDANCAALGEKWLGAGRDVTELCMITLGTGVGGGFVIHGRPWHGLTGMAGELGHMTVFPDGHPCGCGNHGCLEQYASATAIERMAREAIRDDDGREFARCMQADRKASSRTVYECAAAGNDTALKIFATVGQALGIVLANLVNALDFPLYVVGGGVSRAWDVFSPALLAELRKRSIVFRAGESDDRKNPAIAVVPARLADDAGLVGAARLLMIARNWSTSCCSV